MMPAPRQLSLWGAATSQSVTVPRVVGPQLMGSVEGAPAPGAAAATDSRLPYNHIGQPECPVASFPSQLIAGRGKQASSPTIQLS